MRSNFVSDRMRRMVIGFSTIFGLQMMVAWVAISWLNIAGDNDNIAGLSLIITVALYFGGGLVLGLLKGKMMWLEPLTVTAVTVVINALFYKIGTTAELTLISIALTSKSPALPFLLNSCLVIMAVLGGVFLGARIKVPVNDWINRAALIAGFLSVILGPYLLLNATGKGSGGFPWYVLVIIILALFSVVGIGYVLSTREHHEADAMSISPDHRPHA